MNRHVPPEGSLDSKIAFIGEAPAQHEVMEGRPLVGRTGQYFNDLLLTSRIARSECYLDNIFEVEVKKVRTKRGQKNVDLYFSLPPNKHLLYATDTGFTMEGQVYADRLVERISKLKSNIVVPMGNPAMEALTGKRGIVKWRGSVIFPEKIGKKVMPTIHPAAIFRTYMYKHYILFDFRRARDEMVTPIYTAPDCDYHLTEGFSQYMNYLRHAKMEKSPIAFDIEVMNQEVSCISFADTSTNAISIPFRYNRKEYFTLPQEAEIWRSIAEILEDRTIIKVGQNLAFDNAFLFDKYGIVVRNSDDTMIAHQTLFPDFPAGLDFITSMYTKEPYYKDEGKEYINWGGSDLDFLLYNAKDSKVCIESFPQIKSDLKRLQNLETYDIQKKLIEPVVFMGHKGLRVDEEGIEKEKVKQSDIANELSEELNSLVGFNINANSSQQCSAYFYIKKRILPYRKAGKITCDEGALKRIARGTAKRKGLKEAQLVLKIRKARNFISKSLNVKLRNGRFVCSYRPVTKMGRLSSSADLFGYGTNSQNQPKIMNNFFLADPGYLIYNVDLSQADNRTVAYLAPEPRMIRAFENKEDVHSLTASLIFDIPPERIKEMDKAGTKCPLGYGDQTHRHWGKGGNHKLNFGMGYRKFAYELELPESEGKMIYNIYHQKYPGVKNGYQLMVRNQLGANNRILENCFGRKYLFKDRWGDSLFNQAYAFIPQSNTADIINRRGIIPIYYNTQSFGKVELLRQVHDSINFQIPIHGGIDYHIRALQGIKKSLEESLTWKTTQFTIPAEFSVGLNLGARYKGKELVNPDGQMEIDMEGDLNKQLSKYWEEG